VSLVSNPQQDPPENVPAWYSPGFFSTASSAEPAWYPAQHVSTFSHQELRDRLHSQGLSCPKLSWHGQAEQQVAFKNRTQEVLQAIQKGALRKAVPIAFLEGTNQDLRHPEAIAWLLAQALDFHEQEGGALYGLWNQERGILGVTPELLFKKDGSRITTMALAGTLGIGTPGEDLLSLAPRLLEDPKERREHQIVIDDICQNLRDLGTLHLSETGVRRAGRLLHLHTPIALDLSPSVPQALWSTLIHRLHPTPALGAAPREAGWKWLCHQEQAQPRSRFGAPFGVRVADEETCVVAIRNIEWNVAEKFCRIGAGAGVVEGSTPEREWNEIERKWNAILDLFGLNPSKEPRR
jgi:menaquinone-specific isochorismate synthase